MQRIPVDIVQSILGFLPLPDVLQFAAASRAFRHIVESPNTLHCLTEKSFRDTQQARRFWSSAEITRPFFQRFRHIRTLRVHIDADVPWSKDTPPNGMAIWMHPTNTIEYNGEYKTKDTPLPDTAYPALQKLEIVLHSYPHVSDAFVESCKTEYRKIPHFDRMDIGLDDILNRGIQDSYRHMLHQWFFQACYCMPNLRHLRTYVCNMWTPQQHQLDFDVFQVFSSRFYCMFPNPYDMLSQSRMTNALLDRWSLANPATSGYAPSRHSKLPQFPNTLETLELCIPISMNILETYTQVLAPHAKCIRIQPLSYELHDVDASIHHLTGYMRDTVFANTTIRWIQVHLENSLEYYSMAEIREYRTRLQEWFNENAPRNTQLEFVGILAQQCICSYIQN